MTTRAPSDAVPGALPAKPDHRDLLIDPHPSRWFEILARGPATDRAAVRLREQLGLPTDRAIVATGHQPIVFHPGVLAKYMGARAAADRAGCVAVSLVADQDAPDVLALRHPVGSGAAIAVEHARLGPENPALDDVALASRPPVEPPELPEPFGPTARAFAALTGERSLGHQAALGVAELMSPWTRPGQEQSPLPLVFASLLHETDLFGELLERLRADPTGAARAYNTAVAAHPEAGVRPLAIDGNAAELPLWILEPGHARRPARSDRLDAVSVSHLAPRAMLLDAVVRLGVADLFIHGTGGASYARATDRWITDWLGREPAPFVTISATRIIDMGVAGITPEQADRAVWLAHHARHDPAVLGDLGAARRKSELLLTIRESPRRDPARAEAFERLQRLLETVRAEREPELRAISEEAIRARAGAAAARIALDRTWPFTAYPRETIDGLNAEIRGAFGL